MTLDEKIEQAIRKKKYGLDYIKVNIILFTV
jgi:hypothetical protein